MIKKLTLILTLTLVSLCAIPAKADTTGDWRLFPAFSRYFKKVVDTPNRTFFIVRGQGYWSHLDNMFAQENNNIFVLDKESNETIALTTRNRLNDTNVYTMAYNSAKGYLLIVYMNGNIDLLYDDDTIYNIPGLKSAVLRSDKKINAISFDAANNRAYLTGKFGYIAINDKKKEIAESHDYGIELFGIARVGSRLIISTADGLLQSPADNRHYSLSDFTPIPDTQKGTNILPLDDNSFAYTIPQVYRISFSEDGTVTQERIIHSSIEDVSEAKDGYLLHETSTGVLLKKNSPWPTYIALPSGYSGKPYGSWDCIEFFMFGADVITSQKYDSSEKTWSITRQPFYPNCPSCFQPWNISWHEKYGMLFCNEIFNANYGSFGLDIRSMIDSFKDEIWTRRSHSYTLESSVYASVDPHGVTVDPINDNLLWIGTFNHGFSCFDTSNPANNKIYSAGNDSRTKNLPGFHSVFPSGWSCQVSKPEFDNDGTLWVAFNTEHTGNGPEIYFWRATDRKNDNISKIGTIKIGNNFVSKYNIILPLKHSKNKNLLVVTDNVDYLAVINHQGSPENQPSASNIRVFSSMYDQDGNAIRKVGAQGLFEDPETGNVWVLTNAGVFDFAPSESFNSDFRVHRCKIARNDGTNLADYLLDGIATSRMSIDNAGNKWFATQGAGVVVTSADGTEIINQFTTENSYLPSNTVYGVACDPSSSKVWFGTENGICEYTSGVTPAQDNYDNVKVYPNPVRPDYYDYVTIDGLMDNSLVKIVDASGSLVKELGRSSGGSIKWDVCGLGGERVKTGVYYIMASQSTEGESGSKVGKILVMQ